MSFDSLKYIYLLTGFIHPNQRIDAEKIRSSTRIYCCRQGFIIVGINIIYADDTVRIADA